jgi:hypothetical protein
MRLLPDLCDDVFRRNFRPSGVDGDGDRRLCLVPVERRNSYSDRWNHYKHKGVTKMYIF